VPLTERRGSQSAPLFLAHSAVQLHYPCGVHRVVGAVRARFLGVSIPTDFTCVVEDFLEFLMHFADHCDDIVWMSFFS